MAINLFQRIFLFLDSRIQILLIFTSPNILTDIYQKRKQKPLSSVEQPLSSDANPRCPKTTNRRIEALSNIVLTLYDVCCESLGFLQK